MTIQASFPALDYDLSPYTGWTRAHWEAIFARMTYGYVLASERYGSPARALYSGDWRNLPDSVDALESFARMASAWGAWLGNPANPACVWFEGREMNIETLLHRALIDGTNPKNPYTYWGDMNHMSQHIVEAADMAVAIWLSRERVFFKMPESEQAQVMAWLAQVDGKGTYPDNWVLFSAMAQTIRLKLGYLVSEEELDFRLAQTRAFYYGDGWYVDGEGDEFELYNAWMFGWHYLLWAWIDGERRPEDCQKVLDRARSFISGFQYFFGANGSYPAWGRSIVYRFAAVAVFATGYLHKIAPDDPGLLRRISSGCIRYFYDHGLFDPKDHHLWQGYHGDFPAANESYISPGSVYWACHGLFGLYFDPDDPFWTATESPLPVEREDFDLALPAPGFVLSGRRATGQVILLNSRSGIEYDSPRYNYRAKYSKFAYSTHFPYNVLSAMGSYTPDAMLALVGEEGIYSHRQTTRESSAAPGMIWCDFNEIVKGEPQKVRVAVFLWEDVQIRLAYILPTFPVRVVEGPGTLGCDRAATIVRKSDPSQGWEYAEVEGRALGIRRLWGYDAQHASRPFLGYSNLNLAYSYSELPLVAEKNFSAAARGFASASLLRPSPFDPSQVFEGISISVDSSSNFHVALPDGEQLYAALGFEKCFQMNIGGLEIQGNDLRCVRMNPQTHELCGINLTRVADLIELSAPGTLRLKRKLSGGVSVTTSTGLTFSGWLELPIRRVEAKTLAGIWEDVTKNCTENGISAELVQTWACRNERTLVDFRVNG